MRARRSQLLEMGGLERRNDGGNTQRRAGKSLNATALPWLLWVGLGRGFFLFLAVFLPMRFFLSDFSVASSASRRGIGSGLVLFQSPMTATASSEYLIAYLLLDIGELLLLLLTWQKYTLFLACFFSPERVFSFGGDPVRHKPSGRVRGCAVWHRTPYHYKIGRLKRLAGQSSGGKPRYILKMLNRISMSISAEYLPKSSIECAGTSPFASV